MMLRRILLAVVGLFVVSMTASAAPAVRSQVQITTSPTSIAGQPGVITLTYTGGVAGENLTVQQSADGLTWITLAFLTGTSYATNIATNAQYLQVNAAPAGLLYASWTIQGGVNAVIGNGAVSLPDILLCRSAKL